MVGTVKQLVQKELGTALTWVAHDPAHARGVMTWTA